MSNENDQRPVEQSIELDCAPGYPRPDDLIEGVIKDTGLPLKEAASKFFGNFKWYYQEVPREEWLAIQPTLKARVEALYHQGLIRYGSW